MRLYDDLTPWYRLIDPPADHLDEATAYTQASTGTTGTTGTIGNDRERFATLLDPEQESGVHFPANGRRLPLQPEQLTATAAGRAGLFEHD